MAEPIRVMQILYGFNVEGGGGGVGRFGIELCRALDPRQFAVTLCGLWDYGSALEQERVTQLNAEGLHAFAAAKWDAEHPYQSFWRAYQAMNACYARQPFDILHSHAEFGDVAVLMMKLRPKPPVVLRSVHYGYRYEWRKRPLRRLLLTNFLYPLLLDRVIGVSQAITDTLNRRRAAGIFKKNAVCLYNAIDLDRFSKVRVDKASKRQSLNIPLDAPLVGSAGRLAEQKGFSTLVEAAALVLEGLPQAYFLIIGEGELEVELKEQSRRLGIQDHVIFTGPRSDVEELFPCLDLFVSSSLWEGLPTVIIESMAAGVPVVATDIPGTTELVENNVNGLLAPKGDAQGLARSILAALGSAAMREKFALRAQDSVQKFSIKTVAASYAALYQRLVERSP